MKIKFQLENNRDVEAPVEEWVAALIQVLPRDLKQALFDRVERKLIAYKTPGRHVMHLEGGHYGMSLKK